MESNFAFLKDENPILYKIAVLAEKYVYSDPNGCLYKCGLFTEKAIDMMIAYGEIPETRHRDSQIDKINSLKYDVLITDTIADILHTIRKYRNNAVHEGDDVIAKSLNILKLLYSFAVWYHQTYYDRKFEALAFKLPEFKPTISIPEKEQDDKELVAVTVQDQSHCAPTISVNEIPTLGKVNANKLKLSEEETRELIDNQLRAVGWEADSINLRYSNGIRPEKGRNLAIAEWPTDLAVCKYGSADYVLFAGLKLVGVIEAKAKHVDVSAVIDNQCKEYSRGIKAEHNDYVIGLWDGYKAPFLFATNGRPYLKQLETKSGIWFRDARLTSNTPKALQGWISPQGLLELLEKDIILADQKLKNMPYDLLRDPSGLNLRPYQIEAVEKAEAAVVSGKQTALLAMATGTGKTRTVLGIIYRLLKSERFKRILFLVDRTALGEQAQDVFEEVKLEDLMTLSEIYEIKKLDDIGIEKETKIHVATVQSLVKRVLYNVEKMPSVTDYDLIIVDEAHRGYILDKEISDEEQLYRDQADYVSKYRTVIEYFDAVKIALTATPALHTSEIFGRPVFEYSYRRAVIEGFLVDHDAPHNIQTKLNTEGINYTVGETITIYDPVTGEITNSDTLEDELHFDVEAFNRRVITENFNRTALKEIANDINPEGDGKTLIYAVNDTHADMIVSILKGIYEPMGVSNDAIMKITGSIGGGNPKKVQEAIRCFKNEKYPNIAVTVDLLTTGIDVPEITTLVFMRCVKSRILFEQMLGRATRLCDKINKTHFEIYDAVGVYESIEPVNTMKPVVKDAFASFDDLLNGLETFDDDKKVKNQVDMLIAKLQRMRRNISEQAMEQFINLSGGLSPVQFASKLVTMPAQDAKDYALKNRELFRILSEGRPSMSKPVVISDKEDELLSHTRGYGNGQAPKDYIESFNSFIHDNINKIAALKVICTRPQDLTRESLKSLKLELDRNNFNETQLNSAWKEWKNEEIVADIISFIRRSAIGSALIAHDERIRQAVEKLHRSHNFNKMQQDWLNRIEKSLLAETIIDRESFESGAFKTDGGYARIDKIFSGQLQHYINELNNYLYDDGGKSA